MSTSHKGKIVWFRPSMGRGVVRSEGGGQFFFDVSEASELDLEAGVQVEFGLSSGEGPTEAASLKYLDGVRTIAYEPPPAKKTKKKPTRKQSQAARRAKGPAKPKKVKGALPEGTMVSHPDHGSGHVVASTKTLVSVEFLTGQRKSFKPSSLKDLSGPDVPKAPKRKKRAATKKTAKKKDESRTVRRKKDL